MSTSANIDGQDSVTVAEKASPLLVLRGTRRIAPATDYDTTVLLFKAADTNHLQGFVQVNGQKRPVIAHINQRHPDRTTGEVKPNFITLTELDAKSEKWVEIGHGNAVNRRSDDKPVHFDEVLFNVQGETLRARVAKGVDESLHRKLGFEHPRVARQQTAEKAAPDAPEEPAERAPARSSARSRS